MNNVLVFAAEAGPHFTDPEMMKGQGHAIEKAVACNSKTTDRKLLGLDRNICYGACDIFILTFNLETYFRIFLKSGSMS